MEPSLRANVASAEYAVVREVPTDRRQEILEYLKLFGYKPERTILQVHIAGFFRKKSPTSREAATRQAAAKRYGGTTFAIVGRTHDPSIMAQVSKPKKGDTSPGYVGYLWQGRDPQGRAPHEILPLDFVPAHVQYPDDWKNMFATKGFLIAMHVPSSFAKDKGALTRKLYRLGKLTDAKGRWEFVSELRDLGYRRGTQYSN